MELNNNKPVETTEDKVSNHQIMKGIDVPFEPIDSQVLIKPLPEIMIEKEFTEYDEDANKDRDTSMDGEEAAMKTEIREVPTDMQKGIVLAIDKGGLNPLPFVPGDTIVYQRGGGVYFDLFKDSKLLKSFEIKGKWLGE